MGKALYLVITSQGKWWVDVEGQAHGPYAGRAEAALEARALARLGAAAGRECEVLVPDEEGRFWIIWSSLFDGADGKSFTPRRIGR